MALQKLVDAWIEEAARGWRPLVSQAVERGEGVYAMAILFTSRTVQIATMLPPGLTDEQIEATSRDLLAQAMQQFMFSDAMHIYTTEVGEGD